uniref:Gag-pol polyprotein n=1 Tax=Solanum tuberosum TaxID=4113 RepID=M1DY98_SOLTU
MKKKRCKASKWRPRTTPRAVVLTMNRGICREVEPSIGPFPVDVIEDPNFGKVQVKTMDVTGRGPDYGEMGAFRVREFLRINPPEFYGSKVEEDPNGFIEEVYKVLVIIGVSSIEKAELAAYQLKDVAQIWPQGMSNESLWPSCARCGKRHDGRCLASREGCSSCGESGHMMKDCPNAKATRGEGKQVASSSGDVEL